MIQTILTKQEQETLKVLLGKHTHIGGSFSDTMLREILLIATGKVLGMAFADAVSILAADIQKELDDRAEKAAEENHTGEIQDAYGLSTMAPNELSKLLEAVTVELVNRAEFPGG